MPTSSWDAASSGRRPAGRVDVVRRRGVAKPPRRVAAAPRCPPARSAADRRRPGRRSRRRGGGRGGEAPARPPPRLRRERGASRDHFHVAHHRPVAVLGVVAVENVTPGEPVEGRLNDRLRRAAPQPCPSTPASAGCGGAPPCEMTRKRQPCRCIGCARTDLLTNVQRSVVPSRGRQSIRSCRTTARRSSTSGSAGRGCRAARPARRSAAAIFSTGRSCLGTRNSSCRRPPPRRSASQRCVLPRRRCCAARSWRPAPNCEKSTSTSTRSAGCIGITLRATGAASSPASVPIWRHRAAVAEHELVGCARWTR